MRGKRGGGGGSVEESRPIRPKIVFASPQVESRIAAPIRPKTNFKLPHADSSLR